MDSLVMSFSLASSRSPTLAGVDWPFLPSIRAPVPWILLILGLGAATLAFEKMCAKRKNRKLVINGEHLLVKYILFCFSVISVVITQTKSLFFPFFVLTNLY